MCVCVCSSRVNCVGPCHRSALHDHLALTVRLDAELRLTLSLPASAQRTPTGAAPVLVSTVKVKYTVGPRVTCYVARGDITQRNLDTLVINETLM